MLPTDPRLVLELTARVIDPCAAALIVAMIVASVAGLRRWLAAAAPPALLIEDGHVDGEVLRRRGLTDEDVRWALASHGLAAFAEVQRGYVDADGEILLIGPRLLPA